MTYTQNHSPNNKDNFFKKLKLIQTMHTIVNKEDLIKNLELISRISTKHSTLAVLQCVLLESTENNLYLKATNLDIGVETKISAKTDKNSTLAVPAGVLLQTVSTLPSQKVTLKCEDKTLIVESGGSSSQIKTLAFDEFPTIPKLDNGGQTINGALFALGIKTVAFAASVSSIKPELGSIYITQEKEHTLTFVATDSFRLMEKTLPQKGVALANSFLVPQKNALELVKVCEAVGEDPVLTITDNLCSLTFPSGFYINVRLTNSSFPDYTAIIPKEYVAHTTLLKTDLINALKKASIFMNQYSQATLETSGDTLVVSATNDEVGETTETIGVTNEGDDIKLSFNQRYLNEPLGHINDESLELHFAGSGRPLVLGGVGDKTLRCLVMPMNK